MMPTEVQEEVCIQYQKARLNIKPSQGGLFGVKASDALHQMVAEAKDDEGLRHRSSAESTF